MTMWILTFASCLAATVPSRPAAAADPVPVYRTAVEHIRAMSASHPELPVILEPTVYAGNSGRAGESHTAEVLHELGASGRVQIGCRKDAAAAGCSPPGGKYVSVSLGPVIELPDTARVKVLPEERTPGVPLPEMLARIPDSLAVPADVAVDVVVHTPCPASPDSARCNVPDILAYRYFLRAGGDGGYLVVTRWPTGAA